MIEIVISAMILGISALSLTAFAWWRFSSHHRDDIKGLCSRIDDVGKEITNKFETMQKDVSNDLTHIKERLVAVERDIKWIKKTMEDDREYGA
jgi:hypothetical protein